MSLLTVPASEKKLVIFALCAAVLAGAGCDRERDRLLKEATNGERAEIRASALTQLAEMKREEDFPLFLKAAHEQAGALRQAGALGLGRSGDTKAIDTLGELLADGDEDVLVEAARGLATFNTDKSRAYLLNAYGRGGAQARAAVAEVMTPALLADAVKHEAQTLWERNVKVLESGALAERCGAAEELGRSGRGDAVERLLPLLGNDSILLAASAARGLGVAHDRRAVNPLTAVLKENYQPLREAVAEALGNLGDPSAAGALEKLALEGGSTGIAAVRALGQLGHGDEARKSLCNVAANGGLDTATLAARFARDDGGCAPEPVVARLARGSAEALVGLQVLAVLGGNAGVQRVTAMLEDSDPKIRIAAAKALAELDATGMEAKVEKLLNNEAQRIGVARAKWIPETLPAVYMTGFEPGPSADQATDEAMGTHRVTRFNDLLNKVDAHTKAQAEAAGMKVADRAQVLPEAVDDLAPDEEAFLGALSLVAGHLHMLSATPVLQRLTTDPGEETRGQACEALATLGSEDGLVAAGHCLDDDSPSVIRATVRGLRRLGEKGGPVLLAALDRRRSERADIARALGELKVPGAAAKVTPLLSAGGVESVEAAVALGRLGDKSATQPLVKALKDPRTPARLELISALGELSDPTSVEALTRELYHERSEVRAAAARAVGRVGKGSAASTLEALRFDYYAEVRRAVEEASKDPSAPASR